MASKFKKIIIEGEFAHYKKPNSAKYQKTYSIPPISNIIGTLKNLFGEDINDFNFGYIFESNPKRFKDIVTIYKEINIETKVNSDRFKNGEWKSDITEIYYHYKPRLIIYTDIDREISLKYPLLLGKTDCLGTLGYYDTDYELINKLGSGYNQWTPKDIGNGELMRIATETIYNKEQGLFDIETKLLRLSESFDSDKFYDEEEEQNIMIWEYKTRGEVNEK